MTPVDRLLLSYEEIKQLALIFAENIDRKSPFTKTHSQVVARVATRIAESFGFSRHECLQMEIAGLFMISGNIPFRITSWKSPGSWPAIRLPLNIKAGNIDNSDIEKSLKGEHKISFLPENHYYVGKDRKDTTDWVVYDNDSALFIECKTKRLKLPAKLELDDNSYVNEELGKMAEFVLQVYKSIEDYKKNSYPSFKFDKERRI